MSVTRTIAVGVAAVLLTAAGCSSDSKESGSSPDATQAAGAADATDAAATTSPSDSASPATTGDGADAESVALPADWPAEFALPDGVVPTQVTEAGPQRSLLATVNGDVEAALDALEGQLTAAGYEIVQSNFTPSELGGFGGISARGTAYTVAATFGPNSTGDFTQLTLLVADVAP